MQLDPYAEIEKLDVDIRALEDQLSVANIDALALRSKLVLLLEKRVELQREVTKKAELFYA